MMVNNTTPLIKINEKIYAKLETYQPTGSVKDRMVSYIIDQALRDGKITPGYTELIEATSGNTGVSLAAYAARLCCPCTIVMPQNMSEQRKTMMKAFGATILEVSDNAFQDAIKVRDARIKESYKFKGESSIWTPNQFENKLNIKCHYETTASEICDDITFLNLDWQAFVHGAGTGGTMMGVKKFVDHYDLGVECILTQPFESAEEHGIQGINDGQDFLLDTLLIDQAIKVKTKDAIARMKRFAKEFGLLVGISSGANLCAAEEYVKQYNPQGVVITMLCDRGERYL